MMMISMTMAIPYCKDPCRNSKQCSEAGNEAPGGLCTGAGPVKMIMMTIQTTMMMRMAMMTMMMMAMNIVMMMKMKMKMKMMMLTCSSAGRQP